MFFTPVLHHISQEKIPFAGQRSDTANVNTELKRYKVWDILSEQLHSQFRWLERSWRPLVAGRFVQAV
ncbi:hypothetical protein IX84_16715 [Phaeodactylibacter xiamenensis]|uniref:Uncharacterized protein n=1 Tax=Phaeodactylibacter xiamenensis TaxID=1524460 RepID=A0A098S577_9BACT|nr:hypothetical protein IX84_16715 [Phaeodactylibacter xiamenensis]